MECNKKREVSRFQATKTGDFLKSPDSCICISLSNVFWYPFTRRKAFFLFVTSFFLSFEIQKKYAFVHRYLS